MGSSGLIPEAASDAPWDIVLLDRDGTVNVRVDGYVGDPDDLVLLPGAAAAISQLNRAGCRVALVTNQRGLATGRLTWAGWQSVMDRLRSLLAEHQAHLDWVALCPHDEGECDCRKPAPGLFRDVLAAAPWATPGRCAMVGDMPSDVVPARAMGMHAIELGDDVPTLAAAVDVLLAQPAGEKRCSSD